MDTLVLPDSSTTPAPRPGGSVKGMGWLPDRPDLRDHTLATPSVRTLLAESRSHALRTLAERTADSTGEPGAGPGPGPGAQRTTTELPATVDLRAWCSPIEDQGELGSCTANAACGVVEYLQRRSRGQFLDGSRLFLYKVTRQYLGLTGDTGAYLRSTMGALALFGVPPERYYPYEIATFDADPPAFSFAFAQNYQAIEYYRLDPVGTDGEQVLADIRSHLAAGWPVMFGFTVYGSISRPQRPGEIPFPAARENVLGGHAIVAVGYDDARVITNPVDGSSRTGAFLIRNSWGSGWGEAGYGWLPYEYARRGVAQDWWTMTQAEWTDTAGFDE